MLFDMVSRFGAMVGAAIAAAWKTARTPSPSRKGPVYVRLSAEDSDRVEKIEALLVRLIALEEQTQRAIERLASEMAAARLEQARGNEVLRFAQDSLAALTRPASRRSRGG